jgi:hypothetical protein
MLNRKKCRIESCEDVLMNFMFNMTEFSHIPAVALQFLDAFSLVRLAKSVSRGKLVMMISVYSHLAADPYRVRRLE